jgi:hypothetical protein
VALVYLRQFQVHLSLMRVVAAVLAHLAAAVLVALVVVAQAILI